MSDTYKRRLRALHGLTITMLLAPLPAVAADPGTPRSGFYVGGHMGYLFGNGNATFADPTGVETSGAARLTAPSTAACRPVTSITSIRA